MSDSTASSSISQGTLLPKLVGASNYSNWSFRLKFYFMGHDLWDVVTGQLRPMEVSGKQPTDSACFPQRVSPEGSTSYGYPSRTLEQ